MNTKTVWKFIIHSDVINKVNMPAGAEVLSVQNQDGDITMWALVDPAAERQHRYFEVVDTGHPLPYAQQRTFIGTVQIWVYVWHVFELVKL